jgi:hypothetical protein
VGSGNQTFYFTATATTMYIVVGNGSGTASVYCDYDNISVKELAGNHATAPSDPARPILRARYNLATYTEEFNNAAWGFRVYNNLVAATVTPNAGIAPNGTLTADQIALPTSRARMCRATANPNTSYTFSCWVKTVSSATVEMAIASGAAGALVTVQSIVLPASIPDWTRYTYTITTGATIDSIEAGFVSTGATGDILVWGADLRVTNDALNQPAYQRVAAATDYDTAGFLPYLEANGATQSMSTSAIDFSATDKMTVFAGVRKLSEGAILNVYAELGNWGSNVNGFNVGGSASGGANYVLGMLDTTGTYPANTYTTYAAPITNLITGSFDRAQATVATEIVGRINGAAVTGVSNGLTPVANANFGNLPLYIGARNNASLWFNGRLYSLIIRGAASSASEIAATENWVNGKTGAY